MATLAATLKLEIKRLAAREMTKGLRALRRVQRQLQAIRRATRAQRKLVTRLERNVTRLRQRPGAARGAGGARGPRMSADSIRALRSRLRMTREQFSKLVGVSPGSIFGWETGRTVPRGRSVARLREVKKMGVRRARARVDGSRARPAGRSPRLRGRRAA